MTREEQIIEAGERYPCESRLSKTYGHNMYELAYINRNLAFEAGAKWADENPKDGMVSLDKVCNILYDMLHDQHINDRSMVGTFAYDNVVDFVEDFCKSIGEVKYEI